MAEELVENGSSRGEFLARGAGIAGLAVGAGVWAGGMAKPSAEAAGDVRSYTSGHFQLELSGILIGLLKSFDGGAISAEVVEEETRARGADREEAHRERQVRGLHGADRLLAAARRCTTGSTRAGRASTSAESGAIILADQDFNAKRSITFNEALLSEVKIPACDASSKETGYMGVKFAPEVISEQEGVGQAHVVEGPESVAAVELQAEDRRPAVHEGLEDRRLHDQAGDRDRADRRYPLLPQGAGQARVPEPEGDLPRVRPRAMGRVVHQHGDRRGPGGREGGNARACSGRASRPRSARSPSSKSGSTSCPTTARRRMRPRHPGR